MARIYSPKQRQSDRRWNMTCGSDDEGWTHPIGYCAGWHVEDHRFHTDGHATSAEASACWDAYVLDTELTFRSHPSAQHQCQVCDAWTQGVAHLGREFLREFHLCPEHQTRDHVKALRDAERAERRKRAGT
jgi:hypothetical protein